MFLPQVSLAPQLLPFNVIFWEGKPNVWLVKAGMGPKAATMHEAAQPKRTLPDKAAKVS